MVQLRAGSKKKQTHNLVNHDQNTRLCVLHCLEVAVDGASQTRVHCRVEVAIEARRLNVWRLGHQQKDVGLGGLGDEVQLVQDGGFDVLSGAVDDEVRVDVDKRRALCHDCQPLHCEDAYACARRPTREMGVELRILQRIELTISSSPDRHTLVTRARNGPRCRPGSGLDSADTTVAETRPSVCSPTSRHRARRLSTFWAWTGSLWVGVPSAVPSGMVQRAFAPGLAHMMSSGSGPARLLLKGTLKLRLTWVPGGMTGGAEVAVLGRLIGAVTGMSWLDLENGKPADGVIFSQPCRA